MDEYQQWVEALRDELLRLALYLLTVDTPLAGELFERMQHRLAHDPVLNQSDGDWYVPDWYVTEHTKETAHAR